MVNNPHLQTQCSDCDSVVDSLPELLVTGIKGVPLSSITLAHFGFYFYHVKHNACLVVRVKFAVITTLFNSELKSYIASGFLASFLFCCRSYGFLNDKM